VRGGRGREIDKEIEIDRKKMLTEGNRNTSSHNSPIRPNTAIDKRSQR